MTGFPSRARGWSGFGACPSPAERNDAVESVAALAWPTLLKGGHYGLRAAFTALAIYVLVQSVWTPGQCSILRLRRLASLGLW